MFLKSREEGWCSEKVSMVIVVAIGQIWKGGGHGE